MFPNAIERVERSLRLIKEANDHSFLKIDAERARRDAEYCGSSTQSETNARTLNGLLFSVKDSFDVAGEVTAAGSKINSTNNPATRDAPVVASLRALGAVLVGRNNMSEYSFSGLGINPHYGTPINAIDPALVPGGSSSGGGVAAAKGYVDVALGTDTGGSIRVPAACNGIVGFKPSQSRYSSEGIFPASYSLDSVGLLSRRLSTIIAVDEALSTRLGERAAVAPARRIGVPYGRLTDNLDANVAELFGWAVAQLKTAGYEVVSLDIDPIFREIVAANHSGSLATAEAVHIHKDTLESRAADFDQMMYPRIARGLNMGAKDYVHLLRLRNILQARLDNVISDVDIMILPTLAGSPPELASLRDSEAYVEANKRILRNTSHFNFLDLPALSMPLGGSVNCAAKTTSLMFIGRRGEDDAVLRAASDLGPVVGYVAPDTVCS